MDQRLKDYVAICDRLSGSPVDCVTAAAPHMLALLAAGSGLLTPAQKRDDPTGYARNAIHIGAAGGVSLFALVWRPGQWTPVHDHGSWGVVGILEGVLEERNFIPAAGRLDDGAPIDLQPGGLVMLTGGSVSTFVPNPDHIHVTGVPADRAPAISLHLYGRAMTSFHIYDLAARDRRLVDVEHYESR